jgi:hypothetical protein
MRDSFLALDSSTLPGIGRDITRETLQDTSSPEVVALQAASEVIKTQLELLTRSISEGGQLTEDESRIARSVIEESLSRTGGLSATQAERSDISGRTQQALQDMSDAGVDLSTLVSETDIFLKGLDSTVTGLSESSTILSNILSAVALPDEDPIPSVEGGESSALSDSLAGALTAAQSQEAAAKIQLEAVNKFSNDFNNGLISIEQFTEKAGALSQALADGVNVVNETIAEVTLRLPEGEARRLSSVEESVENVGNVLREFINNNLN